MPTLLRRYGYRFHFYTAEPDEPPHVHIDGHGAKMKVWLRDLTVAKEGRIPAGDRRRIMATLLEEQVRFLEAWHERFD